MSHTNDDDLDDAEVSGLDEEDQRRALLKWFRARYVAPEDHRLLINHQDWLSDEDEEAPEAFANSDEEPVDALEVLTKRFSHVVSDESLSDIAGELETTAIHWFRIIDIDVSREEERDSMALSLPYSGVVDKPRPPVGADAALILTPRFPNGIRLTDIPSYSDAIQKETMVAWFLATHAPATGAYFGFSGSESSDAPQEISTEVKATSKEGPRIVGFNEGSFFNGGRASELLVGLFGTNVAANLIDEIAPLFEGLWERRAGASQVSSTSADAQSALVATLDALRADIEKFSPQHGGIGHNQPPEDELPITRDEQASTLLAIEEMRLAVSSGSDYSVLDDAWHGILQITTKLGSWALKQTNAFISGMVEEGGKAIGKSLPYLICAGLGAWHCGNSIQVLVERLIHASK